MGLRKLRLLGDDILRKQCRSVDIVDDRIKALVTDMIETMYHEEGAGLAAPQIGVLKRICVVDMGRGLKVLINPEIIDQSGEQEVYEACLSVPNQLAKRKRPLNVTIEATNLEGQRYTIQESGEMAKCLCHELDHLNGILYIDDVIEFIDPQKGHL